MRLLRPILPLVSGLFVALPLAAQKAPVRQPPKTAAPKEAPAKPVPAPEVPKFAYLQGVVFDSIHGDPLVGALIQVENAGRLGASDSLGRFLVDSIPPGSYRVIVDHPLLDTLGIALVTAPMTFVVNEITHSVLAVPDAERLTGLFCPAARRLLGPGALVGRVREPDTDEPAVGARVSFVYYDPDPPGLPAQFKVKKQAKLRETTVGADGTYRLCGLPATFDGKLQAQRRDGGATAEVPVQLTEGTLALRSMSVAALPRVAGADSAQPQQKPPRVARVLGRVLSATGAPVVGARVELQGTSAATRTRADGSFVLDSLPSGTQAVVVRQLGFKPIEQTVELTARTPARLTVKLGVFVPELTPVEVVSRRDEGLQRVGFLDRKRMSAGGHFVDPETIEKRHAQLLTDLLRTIPGIRVSSTNGQAQVYSTRTASQDGCVTIYVDGAPWSSLEPGDLDSFVRPNEVAAIEVYNGTSVPPQFTTPGQSCASVVVWTKTRVQTRSR